MRTPYEIANIDAWNSFLSNNVSEFRNDVEHFRRTILYAARQFGYGLVSDNDIGWTYSVLLVRNCLLCGLKVPLDAGEFLSAIREGFRKGQE